MTAFDNFLSIFILTLLAIIGYLRITNKTLGDLWREILDVIAETREVRTR